MTADVCEFEAHKLVDFHRSSVLRVGRCIFLHLVLVFLRHPHAGSVSLSLSLLSLYKNTYIYTHTHTYIHIYRYTRTRTHTHTHMYVHTHTHTPQLLVSSYSQSSTRLLSLFEHSLLSLLFHKRDTQRRNSNRKKSGKEAADD